MGTSPPDRFDISRRQSALALAIGAVLWALAAALIRQDASFDVAHYQLYNGWAVWNGRADIDLAPAEIHSFFNPVMQAFIWLLIETLSGLLVASILGLIQGVQLIGLYLLARVCLPAAGRLAALIIAIAGFVSVANFYFLGSVRHDYLGVTALVFGLWLVFRDRPKKTLDYLLAGLLVGLTLGLKPVYIFYALWLGGTVMIVTQNWPGRFRAVGLTALGGFIGVMITGGFWYWHLWSQYGNPLFPMMSGVFPSELVGEGFNGDSRKLPDSVWAGAVRPLIASVNTAPISEFAFRDYRALLFLLAVPAGLIALRSSPPGRIFWAILLPGLCVFWLWANSFSVFRYISAIWVLGPLMLLMAWQSLNVRYAPYLLAAIIAAMSVVTQSRAPVYRPDWRPDLGPYYEVSLPDGQRYDNAMVIYAGDFPGAFTAPFFPQSARFTHLLPPAWSEPALAPYREAVWPEIAGHDGPLYAIIATPNLNSSVLDETLNRLDDIYGLAAGDCQLMTTDFDSEAARWAICPLSLMD